MTTFVATRRRAGCLALLFPALLALPFAASAAATIRYVDDSAPLGGNGLSWNTAFRHITQATDASVAGDEVRVAGGTYWPDTSVGFPNGSNNRTKSIVVASGVRFIGSYAGYGAPDPNVRDLGAHTTIISGDLLNNDGAGLNADNTYHILRTTGPAHPATLIDGVVVAWGNADTSSPIGEGGGGLRVEGGTPTLVNCMFSANDGYTGGAIRVETPLASNALGGCTFLGNTATQGGGAIDFRSGAGSVTINGCYFDGNTCTAYHGGAVIIRQGNGSTNFTMLNSHILNSDTAVAGAVTTWMGVRCTVADCTFIGNSSPVAAAALNAFSRPMKLSRCDFTDNFGATSGAVSLYANDGGTAISHVGSTRLWNNVSSFPGGAGQFVPKTTFVNTIVAQNYVFSETTLAGGLLCEHDTDIRHCTFTENVPNGGRCYGGSFMANSILWNNSPAQWAVNSTGDMTIKHSIVQGGWPTGGPIFLGDPQFVAVDAGDLRLSDTSPGVNTGLLSMVPVDALDLDQDGNSTEFLPIDIDGAARIQGPAPDLGAHEGGTTYVPPMDGAEGIDPGETVIVVPSGGSPLTPTVSATITNLDGPVGGSASITEIGWDIHPDAGGFTEDAAVAGFETSIPIGSHRTQIRVPFNLFTLYPHGDLPGMRCTLFDPQVGAWRLAVSGNDVAAVNGGGTAIGQFHLIYATPGAPPNPPTAHGDHGVWWNPQALKGFVFANVDIDGDFGVGRNLCTADLGPGEGDGLVDGVDIGEVLTGWGATGSGIVADIDANGVVDGGDLALVLGAWGGCLGSSGGIAGDDAPEGPSDAWLALSNRPRAMKLPEGFDPMTADVSKDGHVNGSDLGLLLAGWGEVNDPMNAAMDFDGDGVVDGADLGLLLAAWTG